MNYVAAPRGLGNSRRANKPDFLSESREHHLIERWQKYRDHNARSELVTSYLPFIYKQVSNFMRAKRISGDIDELVNIAIAGPELPCDRKTGEIRERGFLHAIENFDLEMDCRLSTFGHWWIRDALSQWWRNERKSTHAPLLTPTIDKIERVAAGKDVKPETKLFGIASLEAPLAADSGGEFTLHDVLADEEDARADEELSAGLRAWVAEDLDERERRVIDARFFQHVDIKPKTLTIAWCCNSHH